MNPRNLLRIAAERLSGLVEWDHLTSPGSVDPSKFEVFLLGKHVALVLFCLGTFFGLKIFNPDWVAEWGWLVDDWVAPVLLMIASVTFSFGVSHVVRASGGSTRRQFLIGLASFAAATVLSNRLNAARRKGTQHQN